MLLVFNVCTVIWLFSTSGPSTSMPCMSQQPYRPEQMSDRRGAQHNSLPPLRLMDQDKACSIDTRCETVFTVTSNSRLCNHSHSVQKLPPLRFRSNLEDTNPKTCQDEQIEVVCGANAFSTLLTLIAMWIPCRRRIRATASVRSPGGTVRVPSSQGLPIIYRSLCGRHVSKEEPPVGSLMISTPQRKTSRVELHGRSSLVYVQRFPAPIHFSHLPYEFQYHCFHIRIEIVVHVKISVEIAGLERFLARGFSSGASASTEVKMASCLKVAIWTSQIPSHSDLSLNPVSRQAIPTTLSISTYVRIIVTPASRLSWTSREARAYRPV